MKDTITWVLLLLLLICQGATNYKLAKNEQLMTTVMYVVSSGMTVEQLRGFMKKEPQPMWYDESIGKERPVVTGVGYASK